MDRWLTQDLGEAVYWIEQTGGRRARQRPRIRLAASPIDVGTTLRTALFDEVPTVILTSATLSVGRPPKFDAEKYRGRNVIERGYCRLKQWRGLATRYDKLAVVYRAAVVLNGVVAWLNYLRDTP